MKKKLIIIAILAILLAGCGIFGYYYWQYKKEDQYLSTNPQTKDAYATIKQRKEDIKKDPKNYDAYMSLAFYWKGIGEITREEKYSRKAVDVYDKVIKIWGPKAYLPFINQANVYILLEEYEKAEDNLKITLEIDPGEQALYVALTDLYRNYMHKDKEDIIAVFEKGIKTVIGGGNLVVNYASYLREIEDYEKSLKYYKMLQQAYPQYSHYDSVIKELEGKVSTSTSSST